MAIPIIEPADLRAQLNFAPGQEADDQLMFLKIDAAQNHIERLLGFKIRATYGGEGQEEIPPALVEAVLQLAAWWFEQRETAAVGTSAALMPYGVAEIINEYREWNF